MAKEIVCLSTDFDVKYYTKLHDITRLDPPMKNTHDCLMKVIFSHESEKAYKVGYDHLAQNLFVILSLIKILDFPEMKIKITLFTHTFLSRLILAGSILFTLTFDGWGQTNIWNGSSSSNWNTAANWSLNLVPTSAHDVEIPNNASGSNDDPVVNAAAFCATLTFEAGNRSRTLTINSGINLQVTDVITINAPLSDNRSKVLSIGDGSLTCAYISLATTSADSRVCRVTLGNGTMTVANNITMNGSAARNQVSISSSGTLNIGGNITGGALTTVSGSTVHYNGANQNIYATPYHHLTTSGSGTKTMLAATTVNGNCTIGAGTILDEDDITMTISGGGALIVNGTLLFSNSTGRIRTGASGTTTLTMGAAGLIRTMDQNGLGPAANASLQIQSSGVWDVTSISTSGTIEYFRSTTSDQTVTDRDYNHLIISGQNMIKIWNTAATRNVNGNFTIETNALFALDGTQNINIYGNYANNGAFAITSNTGTVSFIGPNPASITGVSNTWFYHLTINKSGSAVTVINPASAKAFGVIGQLNVIQGILELAAYDVNYTINSHLTVGANGTLKHSVDWDSRSTSINVKGFMHIAGSYDYSAVSRAHISMFGTGVITMTAPATSLSILTLQNGNFSAIGNLTVNDNFWAMFGTAGSFSTNGNTVTANAALLVNGGQVNIDGGTLSVSGGFNVGYPVINGACVLSSGTLNVDQLNLGIGAVTGTFTHSGGVANISAGVTIAAGSSYICSGSPVINLAGNLTNDGTFTRANSVVNLSGSGVQTIGGSVLTSFHNLTVNNGPGVSIAINATVENTLNLTNGIIATGANTLIINNSTTNAVTGGSAASYINGNLRRGIAAGANTYAWPVGTVTAYTPVSLAFAAGTIAGFLNGAVADGDNASIASSTFDAGKTVNRNWNFTVHSGLTTANYDATFNWISADQDPTFGYASAYLGKYSGASWSYPTIGTRTASSIQITGESGFSSFQVGNSVGCTPPTFTTGPVNTDISCFGGSDGAIILTITSANNAPYTFSVDNGVNYTATFTGSYPNFTLTGLSASTHKIRIKDTSGCESVACP